MLRGATAGLAVGIAVASILLILVIVLLIFHYRSQARTRALADTRAMLAGEKHHSTATTATGDSAARPPTQAKDVEMGTSDVRPAPPRRQKSLRDHLMGPLYRDSRVVEDTLPPLPPAYTRRSRVITTGSDPDASESRQSLTDRDLDAEYARSKDAHKRDTANSYSSRRVTRLMMMM